MTSDYIGRFAPSPSGPLHFGSLVTAVASYLDAKSNAGKWLVRMEDIDPPREQPGAKALIIRALETYGLHHDEPVLFQSTRTKVYQIELEKLDNLGLIFPCVCSRKNRFLKKSVCEGECWNISKSNIACALRFRAKSNHYEFYDSIYGKQSCYLNEKGYCVVKRKDGLFAYQLAVVIDDIFQGVNHIVRGADLIDATFWQLGLFQAMRYTPPSYTHIPLVTDASGKKLSKQYGAAAIPLENPSSVLFEAIVFLQLKPPDSLRKASVPEMLEWGINHWKLPSKRAR